MPAASSKIRRRRRALKWLALRWLALLVVLLAQVDAVEVRAQEANKPAAADENRKAEAELHFRRGLVLAETGQNWNAALAEFLASRRLYPMRTATRNIAVCLRHLGRSAEAYDVYTTLLSEFSSGMTQDQLETIGQEMAATLLEVGQLDLRTAEDGVTVFIDGVQRYVTPVPDPIRVDPGSHLVRLSKPGFETRQAEFQVGAGQITTLEIKLNALREGDGLLVVQEAGGQVIDVFIDGVIVGKTPWRGRVSAGTHLVILQGEGNQGTPPSSAEVKRDESSLLTLRSVLLDSALRVEPIPAHALVSINGVQVGHGVWSGRLPSGVHRIEVTAPGYLASRQQVQARPNHDELVRAALEPDSTEAPAASRWAHRLAFDWGVGPLLAHSLGGSASQYCNCDERTRPLGYQAFAGARYALTQHLGLELRGGYLQIAEKMTRRMSALGDTDPAQFSSSDYQDATTLRGPMLALALSFRALDKTPLVTRAIGGLAFLNSHTSGTGTFSNGPITSGATTSEASHSLLTPFVGTEVRLGYALTSRLSVDAGVAVMFFFPPERLRGGTNNFSDGSTRRTALNSEEPVVLSFPVETVAGPFAALAPSLSARLAL